MPPFLQVIAPIIVIVMMVVVGLELSLDDLRHELRRPWVLGWGIAVQLVLLPAATLALGRALELPTAVAVGMAVLAACPAGGISNAFVQVARGNLALSVSLTAVGAIAAPLTVPLLLSLCLPLALGTADDEQSGGVSILWLAVQLSFATFVPIGAGMAIRHFRSQWAERNRRRLSALAMLGLVTFIAVSIASNSEVLVTALSSSVVPAAIWTGGAVLLGIALSVALRLDARDALTLVIELANRNLGIALMIATGFSDPASVFMFPIAVIAFTYPGSMLASVWLRWRASPSEPQAGSRGAAGSLE